MLIYFTQDQDLIILHDVTVHTEYSVDIMLFRSLKQCECLMDCIILTSTVLYSAGKHIHIQRVGLQYLYSPLSPLNNVLEYHLEN